MNLLISSSVQVSVVVVVALAGAVLLRGRSAAVRHWLLTVAVVCAALVPSLGLVVPRWQLPAFSTRTEPAPEPDVAVRVRPPAIEPAEVISPPVESARVDRLAQVGQWLVVLWLAGGAVCVGMLLAGCIRLATIVSRSRRLTDRAWTDGAADIARAYGLGRPIALLETDHPALLVTWGVRRPKVIVPAAARHWSPDRIRIVLSHELGHVRRGDWIVQIVADLLRAVYWFNPLLWIASRRLRQESEHACDDAVVSLGVDRTEYATHLVDIARTFNEERHTWLPSIPAPAIARSSTLERRITAMLNSQLNHSPLTGSSRFAVAAVLVCVTVLLAGLRAQTFGSVSGTITDQFGGLIPNATITVADDQAKTKHEVRSDATGRFRLVGLPGADYALEVKYIGFATLHATLTLAAGQTLERNLVLQVGSVEETINVTDAPTTTVLNPGSREPLNIRFVNAKVRDVLNFIANAAGINVSYDPDVADRPLTIQLDGVTFEQALNQIMTISQLSYKVQSDRAIFVRRPFAAPSPAPNCAPSSIGGAIVPPTKIRDVRPEYPENLRAAKWDGRVKLEAVIGADGFVKDARATASVDPDAERAAIAAVNQWQFTPTYLNCVPVEITMTVTVSFKPRQ